MARIVTTGFDTCITVAQEPGWAGGDGSAGAIQSSVFRSGTGALHATPGLGLGQINWLIGVSNPPSFCRAYVMFGSFPTVNQDASLFGVFLSVGSVRYSIDAGGTQIRMWVLGVDTAQATVNLSLGQWYRFELESDLSPALGSRIAGIYIDGVQIIRRTNLSSTDASQFETGRGDVTAGGDWYIDDVAINDNTGSAPHNTFPGEGYVIDLYPDADGDADTGAPTRGGTDTGTIWGQLADNGDGSYVVLPANPSDACVSMQNLPSSVRPYDIVRFVEVHARISGASGSAANWFPGIQSQAAGTRVYAGAVSLALATPSTDDDTNGANFCKLRQLTDPQAGGAWTQALVNSMQCIARTTDGNPDTWVYRLWATIELSRAPVGKVVQKIAATQRAAM
jgi:hypothetical protein